MHSEIRIGLLGEFKPQQSSHAAIPSALEAASEGQVKCIWVPTDSVDNGDSLAEFDGIWCVPGMPYRSAAGALDGIRYARISRTPFLGTSAGFQYVLIEFARNALGLTQAEHQKSDPQAAVPLIAPLDAALLGVKSRVHFRDGTLLRKAYGASDSIEEYHCGFGLNPRYRRCGGQRADLFGSGRPRRDSRRRTGRTSLLRGYAVHAGAKCRVTPGKGLCRRGEASA